MPKRDRSSHGTKSRGERGAYNRYISRLDSQPTIEEPLDLDPSSEAKKEYAQPTSNQERPIPFNLRVTDHFEKNWIGYLIAILVFIALFVIRDAQLDLAILNASVADQQRSIDRMNTSIDSNTDSDHN